jgi:predicted extracellular nuclease
MYRALLVTSLALLTACPVIPKDDASDGVDDTDGGGDDTGGGGDGMTIAEAKALGEGANVTLSGVIVTSPLTYKADGFFIQTAGGGENNGLYVFLPAGAEGLFFEVGDEMEITGELVDFYGWTELTVSDVSAIQITGSGEVTINSVDPATVTDWEVWESSLISIGGDEVASDIDSYGAVTLASGLAMDNVFFNFSTELGATYTNVIGQLGYSFETWGLYPRTEADLQGYVAGEGSAPVPISDIQTGVVADGSSATVERAVVTSALTPDGKGFFIADAPGPNNGVYVYLGNSWSGTVPKLGDEVTIKGSVDEYYDLTELVAKDITVTGTKAVPEATELTAAPSDWEPYEGVEVRLTFVELGAEADYGEVSTNFGLNLDDLFVDVGGFANAEYTTVTGHVFYGFETYKVVPDSTDDFVK